MINRRKETNRSIGCVLAGLVMSLLSLGARAETAPFVIDLNDVFLQTVNQPCASGSDCDSAAHSLAVEVGNYLEGLNLPQLTVPSQPSETAFLRESHKTLRYLFEYFGGGPIQHEGFFESDCGPVAWKLSIKADGGSVTVDFFVEGDCNCKKAGGDTRLGKFTVRKSMTFMIFLDAKKLLPQNGSEKCYAFANCDCEESEEVDDYPVHIDHDTVIINDPAPVTDNEAPGTWWGFKQARLYLDPKIMILEALTKRDCSTLRSGTASQDCDSSTRPIIDAAIVRAAAQQNSPQVGLIDMPMQPEGNSNAAEAIQGFKAGLEGWLTNAGVYGFPTRNARKGTVDSVCGPLKYTFWTAVEQTINWSADGELGDWALILVVNFTLEGNCNCVKINGRDVDKIKFTYRHPYDVVFNTEYDKSRIGLVSSVFDQKFCINNSSCDCDKDTDAAAGSEGYVVHFDSPFWCTYGGGSIPLFPGAPPGITPVPSPLGSTTTGAPLTTPVPSPLPIPGVDTPTQPGGSLPPAPGAGDPTNPNDPNDTLVPIPATDDGEDEPASDEPGNPPAPGDEMDPPAEEDPQPTPPITLTIKATTSAIAEGGSVAAAGALIQLNTGEPALAGDPEATRDDRGAQEGELSATTDADGNAEIEVPAAAASLQALGTINVVVDASEGTVLGFPGVIEPADVLPKDLLPYAKNEFVIDGSTFIPVLIPSHLSDGLQGAFQAAGAMLVEPDLCVDPKPLSDPYFSSRETWSQPYPDQWGIQRVGFTDEPNSAWSLVRDDAKPVIIAVIDSGLDWNHLEIDWDSLWRNEDEIPGNGLDDDNNGYIDDTIGWDFWDNDRKPWDFDGHGTFVAGMLFANSNNQTGIAGISRHAKLMVLKAMNAFGHSRASHVAKAIKYAADNGARVINLSLGGPGTSTVVLKAINYAYERGAVVVVAAGNEAKPAKDQVVSGVPNALTVAALNVNDKRSVYSNFGAGVDLAAPGDDILSLRARRTDLLKNIPDVNYVAESAFVGSDRRYYRASGTSFAAPIVAGVAGLVIANNPELSPAEVMRVLKHSARDVEKPGNDHFTGYGMVDAKAALAANSAFFVEAEIASIAVTVESGAQAVEVIGTADANRFHTATIEIGPGEAPDRWTEVATLQQAVRAGTLGTIPATQFAGSKKWTIKLTTKHKNSRTQEFWYLLTLG